MILLLLGCRTREVSETAGVATANEATSSSTVEPQGLPTQVVVEPLPAIRTSRRPSTGCIGEKEMVGARVDGALVEVSCNHTTLFAKRYWDDGDEVLSAFEIDELQAKTHDLIFSEGGPVEPGTSEKRKRELQTVPTGWLVSVKSGEAFTNRGGRCAVRNVGGTPRSRYAYYWERQGRCELFVGSQERLCSATEKEEALGYRWYTSNVCVSAAKR